MINNLRKLGLSYYESKAFEALLKESFSAKELSKKSEIPLGKVYSIISSLKKKDLVKETESRPKRIYIENVSGALNKLIMQKQKEQEELISDIKKIAVETDRLKKQPSRFFQIGTTIGDNHVIQLRTFLEAEKEVCQIFNVYHRPEFNRKSKTIWENEKARAIKRSVVFRTIYPISSKIPLRMLKLRMENPKKFFIRKLDTDFIRCDVIDKKKVLIKLVNKDAMNFGGILFIEDEKLAKNLQEIFEQLWREAEEIN